MMPATGSRITWSNSSVSAKLSSNSFVKWAERIEDVKIQCLVERGQPTISLGGGGAHPGSGLFCQIKKSRLRM
jgi:hypothetical protein